VLTALARGCSNKGIAKDLAMGRRRSRLRLPNIPSKLHLEDRTQAAIYGLEKRLVRLDGALE
jgi:NarL family two-component system response regulator LiaR